MSIESPGKTSPSEKISPPEEPEKTRERSPKEIEWINRSKEMVVRALDKAETATNEALDGGEIREIDYRRIYKFLEEIAEETNQIENEDISVDEVVKRLAEIRERLELPKAALDMKSRLGEKGKHREMLLKKMEEWEQKRKEGQEKAHQKTTSKIDAQLGRARNFFRRRK